MSSFDKNKIEDDELKIIVDDEDDPSESNRLVIDENANNDNDDHNDEQINSLTKKIDDHDLQKQQQQAILASVFTKDFLNNRQQVNLATAFTENFLNQHLHQQQQQNYDFVSNDNNHRSIANASVDSNNNSLVNSLLTRNNNSISLPIPTSVTTQTTTVTTNNSSRGDDDYGSIYRGLYPINEVKQYFRKTNVGNKKLYKCLWNGCEYETWKYSQHISRHIYLKHIGIKKLQCNIDGCGKLFKRPESLVQHKKNHSCGFGIDPQIMKDPNSACGVKNIKRYFSRTLDNDIYVYQCKYGNCRFHTHNSGSIRRHVHNQHVCPYSSPANANYLNQNRHQEQNYHQRITMNNTQQNISLSSSIDSNPVDISSQQSSPSSMINNVTCEVQVQIDEESVFDPMKNKFVTQNSIIKDYQVDESQQKQQNQNSGQVDDSTGDDEDDEDEDDDDEQDDEDDGNSIEDNSILLENIRNGIPNMQFPNSDLDIEDDDNGGGDSKNSSNDSSNHQQTNNDHSNDNNNNNGLYSLKNFKGKYRKVKINDNDDGRDVKFICNQCGFRANSQINLVRHLWSESNFNEFVCENCQQKFPSEFMLYSHRKSEHRAMSPTSSPPPPSPPPPQQLPLPLSLKNEFNIKNNLTQQHQQQQQQIFNPSILSMVMQRNNIIGNHNAEAQNNFNSIFNACLNASMLKSLQEFEKFIQDPNNQQMLQQELQNQQALDLIQSSYAPSSIINHPEMKRPTNFSQLYKKIIDETDNSVQFNCVICSNYTVRTKASMNKHLKNYHSDLFNNNNNPLPPMQIKTNSEQPNDEINEDEHLQSGMSDDNDLNQSVQTILDEQDQALSPGKKYKGHDKSGLYSLKKFPDYYKRTKVEGSGYQYECTKCHGEQEYATKSQASMIRHIWQHKPQDFKCPICGYECENEFALYKHKKKDHPESTSQHNRTKSTSNSSRSKINSFNNTNSIKHSPISNSPIDPNFDLDRMDQDQLIQNPQIITDQCQRSMNFNNIISGGNNMFEMEQEQDYPISMVKNEYNNQADQIIQNKRKRLLPSKTSRRSLQFKKYKFHHDLDTDDDSFKEDPDISETNTEDDDEEESEIAENATEKSFESQPEEDPDGKHRSPWPE